MNFTEFTSLFVSSTTSKVEWDKVTAVTVLVMGALRTLSWILGLIAIKTENTWDNEFVSKFSKFVSSVGYIIGLFGIGNVPKSVKYKPKIGTEENKASVSTGFADKLKNLAGKQ